MSAVGPGDLVSCIQDFRAGPDKEITQGRIYAVTEVADPEELGICAHGRSCRAGGFRLREAPTPEGYFWCAACFKPVGRPAAHFIADFWVNPPQGVTP